MKNTFVTYSCDPRAVAIRKIRRLEMDLKVRTLSDNGREKIEEQLSSLREFVVESSSNYNHWT